MPDLISLQSYDQIGNVHMRLIITRPEPDASATAERLIALGHEPVIDPVMTIEYANKPPPSPDGLQAIAFTSANGLRALEHAGSDALSHLPVFAVGPASADEARAAGYGTVHVGAGRVAGLVDAIAAEAKPDSGAILHPCGENLAGDLQGDLEARDFTVEPHPCYRAVAAGGLGVLGREVLERYEGAGVLLYSPRSARLFAAFAEHSGHHSRRADLAHFCLSQAVADAAGDVTGPLAVADRPEEDALLALLPTTD